MYCLALFKLSPVFAGDYMVLTRYYALNPEIQISVFMDFCISVSGVLGGLYCLVELVDELEQQVSHGLAGHGCVCL